LGFIRTIWTYWIDFKCSLNQSDKFGTFFSLCT
jgi:hypothetical protein